MRRCLQFSSLFGSFVSKRLLLLSLLFSADGCGHCFWWYRFVCPCNWRAAGSAGARENETKKINRRRRKTGHHDQKDWVASMPKCSFQSDTMQSDTTRIIRHSHANRDHRTKITIAKVFQFQSALCFTLRAKLTPNKPAKRFFCFVFYFALAKLLNIMVLFWLFRVDALQIVQHT